jgi:hypothetical protein
LRQVTLPSSSRNGRLALVPLSAKINRAGGRLAQMGERLVRNEEAGGSNPLPSTKITPLAMFLASFYQRTHPAVRPR